MRLLLLLALALPLAPSSSILAVLANPYAPAVWAVMPSTNGSAQLAGQPATVVESSSQGNIVIVLPYQPQLLKWVQRNADTDKDEVRTPNGVAFGEPAAEDASANPRRMAFSYPFSEVDGDQDSDLTWLGKRLLAVASQRGLCPANASQKACAATVKSLIEVRRDGTLPGDWIYPADSERGKAQAAAKLKE